MKREEIIAIAGEPVGYNYIGHFGFRPGLHPDEKALYTAELLVAAVLAEREECAKVAEDGDHVVDGRGYYDQLGDAKATAHNIATAIRARGNHV